MHHRLITNFTHELSSCSAGFTDIESFDRCVDYFGIILSNCSIGDEFLDGLKLESHY